MSSSQQKPGSNACGPWQAKALDSRFRWNDEQNRRFLYRHLLRVPPAFFQKAKTAPIVAPFPHSGNQFRSLSTILFQNDGLPCRSRAAEGFGGT